LAATDDAPRIRIMVDRQRQVAVLSAAQLAEPETGRSYQLWRSVDGAPVPSVTFRPDPSGAVAAVEVPIPADGALSALAVTLEPEGGSTTPTMPILFVGAVGATR
jgi:anti-sigma-K factor RskA